MTPDGTFILVEASLCFFNRRLNSPGGRTTLASLNESISETSLLERS